MCSRLYLPHSREILICSPALLTRRGKALAARLPSPTCCSFAARTWALFHLQDGFPVSRLGLVGAGGSIAVRNMFGTLGESSRKTKGVLDVL